MNVDFKKNSLNTVRFIAAFNVFYGHAVEHLAINMPDFINQFVSFFYGVPLFFTLSGYLIWTSIGNSDSFICYIKKRFWRLYPELWAAVIVELIVLLTLYEHSINWGELLLFAIGQGTVFQFWTPDFLREYGCGCPNGALATIGVLIQFYFLSYATYKLLRNKSVYRWCFALLFSIGVSLLTPVFETMMPIVFFKLYCQTFIPYFWLFLIGAFVSENYYKILPLLKKYYLPLLASALIIYLTGYDLKGLRYGVFFSTFLFLSMLGMAYKYPRFNIKTDVSYAIFIYHMTIINSLIELNYVGNTIILPVAFILSLLLSFASTKTIGDFSMRMKRILQENTPPPLY